MNFNVLYRSPDAQVSTGLESTAPHSDQEPSYTATVGAWSLASASASTHAVTPVPHVAVMGAVGSSPAAVNRLRSSACDFSAASSVSTCADEGWLVGLVASHAREREVRFQHCALMERGGEGESGGREADGAPGLATVWRAREWKKRAGGKRGS
jgi:hypothetical protein